MGMHYFWKEENINFKRTLRIASPLVFLVESHLTEGRDKGPGHQRAPKLRSTDIPSQWERMRFSTAGPSQGQDGPGRSHFLTRPDMCFQ